MASLKFLEPHKNFLRENRNGSIWFFLETNPTKYTDLDFKPVYCITIQHIQTREIKTVIENYRLNNYTPLEDKLYQLTKDQFSASSTQRAAEYLCYPVSQESVKALAWTVGNYELFNSQDEQYILSSVGKHCDFVTGKEYICYQFEGASGKIYTITAEHHQLAPLTIKPYQHFATEYTPWTLGRNPHPIIAI